MTQKLWLKENIYQWLSYVECTCVGKKITQDCLRISYRREPLFPHSMWNLFDRIRDDVPFTNNMLEAHNGVWTSSSSRAQYLWKCIKGFMREDALSTQKFHEHQTASDTSRNPGRDVNKAKKYTVIKQVVENYVVNENMQEFLNNLMWKI